MNTPGDHPFPEPPPYGGPDPQAPVSGPHYSVSGGALVPAVPNVAAVAEQPLCQIGEIMATTTTVYTPVGSCPLRGSRWVAQDQWISSQKTPTWAIVLAIVGFCILTVFSLLFLLAKETVFSGVMQVTVTNGPFTYVARVPVHDHGSAQYIHNQVNYMRAMSLR